jgi:hypothetical protein
MCNKVIYVKSIQGIRLGENSTLLSECQLPALRHLSFTVEYSRVYKIFKKNSKRVSVDIL